MNIFKKSKGFTLIELLIVIAIIAILTSIIYSSFGKAQSQGRDKKRIADMSLIQLSLEGYFNHYGYYPPNLSTLIPTYLGSNSHSAQEFKRYSLQYISLSSYHASQFK